MNILFKYRIDCELLLRSLRWQKEKEIGTIERDMTGKESADFVQTRK
jgi:hypothetical protein